MKAILLARVSSREQEDGQSIPAQVRRLTEYALRKNLTIEETIQLTESSTKETRKQFDALISAIKKRKDPIALVTDTVDRLQRSFRETPLLDELRRQGKIELHFLREGLIVSKDSNSAQLLQWDIGVLFASSYVRQQSDNIKRSIEQAWRNGAWLSKAPYGYKNRRLSDDIKTIEVDKENAPYVIKIFQLYASGNHSFQTIAQEMNKLGQTNTLGGPITSSRIEYILKNPFYYGYMRVKGKLFKHKYNPIISESLFNTVLANMRARKKAPVHFVAKPLLLRGLIKCDHCECTVTGDIKKQKYIYYSCNNSKRICKKKWIREEKLLAPLLTYFDKIYLTDEQMEQIANYLTKAYAQDQEFFKKTQEALRRESNILQSRISKLIDMYLDGKIDSDNYHRKLEEYKNREGVVTTQIQTYDQSRESTAITAKTVLKLAQRSKEIFNSSKLDKKQQILRCIFSNLKLNGEKLHVELHEPFLTMSKSSHQPGWWS